MTGWQWALLASLALNVLQLYLWGLTRASLRDADAALRRHRRNATWSDQPALCPVSGMRKGICGCSRCAYNKGVWGVS